MTDSEATSAKATLHREPRVNKAEKMSRSKVKKPTDKIVGYVKEITVDLQATDAATAVSITIEPKSGATQKFSFDAISEVRQTAISLLIAAKMAGKKVTIMLGDEVTSPSDQSITVGGKKKD